MNLQQIVSALRRQTFILVGVLLLGACIFAWAVTLGRSYEATASVVAFASADTNAAHGSDPLHDPSAAVITPQDVPPLVHSSPLLAAVSKSVHLEPRLAATLKKRIRTKNTLGSEMVALSVTDTQPERAVTTVNAVTQQLRAFESQIATARYDGLIRDLREQLATRAASLQGMDARIAALTESDPYLNPETGASQINQQILGLNQQLDQVAATARGDASALAIAAHRPALARKLAGREIILADPTFRERHTQIGKDLAQRDQTAAGYTSAFPGLAGINDQVAREGSSLKRAERAATSDPALSSTYVAAQLDANKAASAYANDRAQVAAISAELDEARAHLEGSRGETIQLGALRRERDAATTAYAALSQRLASTLADRAQAASIGTVVIVDPAVEATPTLLSQPAALALIIGTICIWLAITLALAADAYDTRLHDRGAVERLYGRPVLTTI